MPYFTLCFLGKARSISSIQAKQISFKNINGENYLFVSKDNMEANIRQLSLKGIYRYIIYVIKGAELNY